MCLGEDPIPIVIIKDFTKPTRCWLNRRTSRLLGQLFAANVDDSFDCFKLNVVKGVTLTRYRARERD